MIREHGCYWTTEGGKRYHIPGCWGAVIYGPKGCYCLPKSIKPEQEKEIAALKKRVAALEKRLAENQTTT